jgi:hypothetical protein
MKAMKTSAAILALCACVISLGSCSALYSAQECDPRVDVLNCELYDGASTITSYFRVTNEGTKEIPLILVRIHAHLSIKGSGALVDYYYGGQARSVPPGRSVEGVAIDTMRDPAIDTVDETKTWVEVESWEIQS